MSDTEIMEYEMIIKIVDCPIPKIKQDCKLNICNILEVNLEDFVWVEYQDDFGSINMHTIPIPKNVSIKRHLKKVNQYAEELLRIMLDIYMMHTNKLNCSYSNKGSFGNYMYYEDMKFDNNLHSGKTFYIAEDSISIYVLTSLFISNLHEKETETSRLLVLQSVLLLNDDFSYDHLIVDN